MPQVPGEMQCRMLGAAVEAWNAEGQPVTDEVGELVCAALPSMPLYLWGDKDGSRYLSSYFDIYPPGHGRQPGGGDGPASMGAVWRHGDWLKIGANGGCTIYGRSDATINRHGLRMGTSEIYSAVEALPEVLDSLVVDLEYLGRESYMPLFVVLRPARRWMRPCARASTRRCAPRSAPALCPTTSFAVAEVPPHPERQEAGAAHQKTAAGPAHREGGEQGRDGQPGCLDWYVAFAAERAQTLPMA